MDFIREMLGSKPQRQLPVVEGDEIFPTGVLDDVKMYREIMLAWTYCFNDVLDANKLHTSLSKLLEIGDWRKLGGRLRLNVST